MSKDFLWWEKWIRGGKSLPESVSGWVQFSDHHGGDLIPRLAGGEPKDLTLLELNYNLMKEIEAGDRKTAAKTLRWMRKRADEIIEKIEADAINYLKRLGYNFD